MSEFVGFDSETANRIVAATRKVEAHPFGRLEPLGTPPTIGTAGRHNIVFRVTSSTITDGMWPIRYLNIETLPAGNPALDFVLEGTEGWGYGLSGASLQLGVDYFGSFVGYKPTDNRAVFVTGVSAGGSLTVKEGVTIIASPCDTIIFDPTDFDLTNPAAGDAEVKTSGLSASRIVYRYACQSGNLVEFAGVVIINRGLIKSWTIL